MTDSRWTKGPWHVGVEGVWRGRVFGSDDRLVAEPFQGLPQTSANANLIAAAPEMYEALEELVRVVGGTLQGYGVLESPLTKAAEVLESARGER